MRPSQGRDDDGAVFSRAARDGRAAPHVPGARRGRAAALPPRAQPRRQQPRLPPARVCLPDAHVEVSEYRAALAPDHSPTR